MTVYTNKIFTFMNKNQQTPAYVEPTQKNACTETLKNLTEEDAIKIIFIYLYPEKDYFSLATTKYLAFPELYGIPVLTYEFARPEDVEMRAVWRIASYGLIDEQPYYLFDLYSSYYSYDKYGNQEFSHSIYSGAYVVNSITGEVIQQRMEDEEGMWIYNENFPTCAV